MDNDTTPIPSTTSLQSPPQSSQPTPQSSTANTINSAINNAEDTPAAASLPPKANPPAATGAKEATDAISAEKEAARLKKLEKTKSILPSNWSVALSKAGVYRIVDPENSFTFKSVKEAKEFAFKGFLAPDKLTQLAGRAPIFPSTFQAFQTSQTTTPSTTPPPPSSNSPVPPQEPTDLDQKAALVAKQFPDHFRVTAQKSGKYTISGDGHVFHSIKQAKAYLKDGTLPGKKGGKATGGGGGGGGKKAAKKKKKTRTPTGPSVPFQEAIQDVPYQVALVKKGNSVFDHPFSVDASLQSYNAYSRPYLTNANYKALESFLSTFCEHPNLVDYANPTADYDENTLDNYSTVVAYHVSLIGICRNVAEKRYQKLTQFKIDMYRLFNNCFLFQKALHVQPSFAAVTNHLRDYFNYLLPEYVLPSTQPPPLDGNLNNKESRLYRAIKLDYDRRDTLREMRKSVIKDIEMSKVSLTSLSKDLTQMLERNGKLDDLDNMDESPAAPSASPPASPPAASPASEPVPITQDPPAPPPPSPNLLLLKTLQEDILANASVTASQKRYKFSEVYEKIDNLSAAAPELKGALNRALGKATAPVYEFIIRGVDGMSLSWVNPIRVVWARETQNRPYYPAVVVVDPNDSSPVVTAVGEVNMSRILKNTVRQLARNESTLKKSDPDAKLVMVEFTGFHDFIWVRVEDTIPFDPDVDPNWSTDPETFERKRITAGAITLSEERRITSMTEAKLGVEEINYRVDDICGNALLSDDEGDDEEDETNFQNWKTKTPIECVLLEGDHPSGDISEGDTEGELLLATHCDKEMYESIRKRGYFVNRMFPKLTKPREPDYLKPVTSTPRRLSSSPKQTTLSDEYDDGDFIQVKKRDFKRDQEKLEKEPEKNARSFIDILGGWDSAKGVTPNMKSYVSSSVHGSGLVGAALSLRGFAGVLNVVGGKFGVPGKTVDDNDEWWSKRLDRIMKVKEAGKREGMLKEHLRVMNMELEGLKKAVEDSSTSTSPEVGEKRGRDEEGGEGEVEVEKKQKVEGAGGEESSMVTQ